MTSLNISKMSSSEKYCNIERYKDCINVKVVWFALLSNKMCILGITKNYYKWIQNMGFKTGVYIANLQTCTSPTSPLPMCSLASLPCLSSFRWIRIMINLIPILIAHCPQAILLQRWHLPPFLCRFCPTITVLSVNVSVLTLVTMLFLFLLESLYFNCKPRLWSASIATAQSSILWVPAAASLPLGRMSKTPCCENCFHTNVHVLLNLKFIKYFSMSSSFEICPILWFSEIST